MINSTRPDKRVVVVHSSDELYGADRMVLQIVEALQSMAGVRVEVWLPVDLPHGATPLCHELERRGTTVLHVELPILRRALLTPHGLVGLAKRARSFEERLRRHRADLVYLTTSACLPAAPAARRAGVQPVVLHLQEMWAGRERRVLSLLAKATTLRIATSTAVSRSSGLHDPHPVVVPNAVPEPSVVGAPLDGQAREGGLRYVVASRWTPRKGYGTLLEAWALAQCPGHLTILGGAPPSGESVDVPALVQALPDPSSVTVVGEVVDVAPHVAAADVVLLPSDEPEGFGLVPIEAFVQGRPAIASRAGGVVDVVTHGVDGWLFPPRDVRALAAIFTSLTPQAVADAGRRGRRAWAMRYAPERLAVTVRALVAEQLGIEPVVAPVAVPVGYERARSSRNHLGSPNASSTEVATSIAV